jgi:hypothetical protein
LKGLTLAAYPTKKLLRQQKIYGYKRRSTQKTKGNKSGKLARMRKPLEMRKGGEERKPPPSKKFFVRGGRKEAFCARKAMRTAEIAVSGFAAVSAGKFMVKKLYPAWSQRNGVVWSNAEKQSEKHSWEISPPESGAKIQDR